MQKLENINHEKIEVKQTRSRGRQDRAGEPNAILVREILGNNTRGDE